jgi:hypothetical protein
VSAAYAAAAWEGFGAAVATAAAALAGLLFIAVSINIRTILEAEGLPSRTAQTLILLVTPLIASLLLIVPDQSRLLLGLELIATGLVIGSVQTYLDLKTVHNEQETTSRRLVGRVFPALISCGSMVIAGATLIGQAGGGLYWLVPGVIAAIVCGLINVWVLLVEILR